MTNEISLQVEDNSPSMEHHRTHLRRPKVITIFLHIIHFVICSVIVSRNGKLQFTLDNYFINFGNALNKIILDANLSIYYVSMYYYGHHNIKQYEKWPKLMSKMENLDQHISKKTPMNDRPIKIVEVLIILAILIPLFFLIYFYLYYIDEYEYEVKLIAYYTLAQSLINSFIFNVIVYVLYHKFQTINKLIMQLDKQFNAPLITSKIKYIRRLHKEICDAIIMVNSIHGLHLLFSSAYCFIIVVSKLHFLYINTTGRRNIFVLIDNIDWIFCTAQFGVTCWICTLVRHESENTKVIISTIALNCNDVNLDNQNGTRNQSNVEVPSENQDSEHNSNRSNNENHDVSDRDRDVKKEINNFSIQLQQHRVAITACNFFEMNNALFICFIGVIINYLAIIKQFNAPMNTKFDYYVTYIEFLLEDFIRGDIDRDENILFLLKNISLQLSDTANAPQNKNVTLLQ